jgi:prepilin-type N-terminal cleavage/methylation domain-containing protein
MKRTGFSLLELLVVLSILGFSTLIAVPLLRNADTHHRQTHPTAVLEMTDLLGRARFAALHQQRTVLLDLSGAGDWVMQRQDPFGMHPLHRGKLALDDAALVRLPVGTLQFRPDGTATVDTVAFLAGGRRWLVVVDPWNARASAHVD